MNQGYWSRSKCKIDYQIKYNLTVNSGLIPDEGNKQKSFIYYVLEVLSNAYGKLGLDDLNSQMSRNSGYGSQNSSRRTEAANGKAQSHVSREAKKSTFYSHQKIATNQSTLPEIQGVQQITSEGYLQKQQGETLLSARVPDPQSRSEDFSFQQQDSGRRNEEVEAQGYAFEDLNSRRELVDDQPLYTGFNNQGLSLPPLKPSPLTELQISEEEEDDSPEINLRPERQEEEDVDMQSAYLNSQNSALHPTKPLLVRRIVGRQGSDSQQVLTIEESAQDTFDYNQDASEDRIKDELWIK